MTVDIRPLVPADVDAVVELWREAGLIRAWNDPREDIRRARAVWPDLLLVAEHDGAVVGSVMAGYDGHRGWLYYLASARAGVGRALVAEAERRLIALGCPKVMLMVRPDNAGVLGYYDLLGYEREGVLVAGKRLIPDTPPPPRENPRRR
ncbi:GNAT family acetyltransferase [Microbacterium oryzae]|uniref:GNAT family acetyltransferase n=1 Tax=Microbacterium oryzae TaxID=743009 RepID=UPI0025AEE91E|nr:GNAT family acetyltransferase [Microbacterium oryzae]MDN3309709.1 GNAT family acetyltransferase [Microbacterium oryzae]